MSYPQTPTEQHDLPSPYSQGYGASYPGAETNILAIISLISGILTWTFCPGLTAIVAIITGHIAKVQIKDSSGQQTGSGLATAGLIMGYVSIAFGLAILCLYLAFFVGLIGLAGYEGISW